MSENTDDIVRNDEKVPEEEVPEEEVPEAFHPAMQDLPALEKTETVKSLKDLGVQDKIPKPDVNYPLFRPTSGPQFPEEYTLETQTGLVPSETLAQVRSHRRVSDEEVPEAFHPAMQDLPALEKTETVKSLKDLGVQDKIPKPDVNYPLFRPTSGPQFPEEYTLETQTGLVPSETLAQVRSHRRVSVSAETAEAEARREKELEFVTFTIDDPENPRNWKKSTKWVVTCIAAFLVVAVAFGSSNVTGGLSLIEDKYNVSLEVAVLTCSIMVCGFAVGPLLWSPLSEIIGRRPVYFISLGIYTIFNIPCALAPNIGGLLVCRFLCGVFASSGLSLAGGTIADIWVTEHRGMAIAYFAAAPYCGPVIGPLMCGWINVATGRLDLIFWVNMAFAGLAMILICAVPETYAPVILKRRAAKLRKETGRDNITTESEQVKLSLYEIIKTCLLRPVMMILTEPVLDLMCLYVVLIYAMLYAFFFAYPVIFGKLYGYNDGIIGLMFIPILIGAGFALVATPSLEKVFRDICLRRKSTPEDRLIGALVGCAFIPISLFILGGTSYKHIIWVGPASSGLSFGFGMVLCYYSVNNYIIDSYQEYAASALAAKVFLRSGGGAAFPLFIVQMYDRLGLQWASWLLAFIGVGMVFIPVVFYKYGAILREKLERH